MGEPLIEMVLLPDPMDGRPAYVQGFGGDTSTAIVAAARQGARTGYISAVGDDMFGDALRGLWTREGVDHSTVKTYENDPTGVCFIDPDPAGRRFTYARRGSAASNFSVDDLPEAVIAEARVLHVSGITLAIGPQMREAAMAAMSIAHASGKLVSYDLNHRPALWSNEDAVEALSQIAPMLDIVFPSDDEARLFFEDETPDLIAERFRAMGAQIVAVKRGADGAYLVTREARVDIPPAASHPVDASGAGDSFAGAFLAWYVETGDPLLAATKAVEVAAATVSGFGAVEPIPRR